MKPGKAKKTEQRERLVKALRDNLKKRKTKERQIQPKNGKSGGEVKN